MPKYSPKCRCCEHMDAYELGERGNKMHCRCVHPDAPKESYIGLTKMGTYRPAIVTSPRWCPLREDD